MIDDELVKKAKCGNKYAFEQIILQMQNDLYRIAKTKLYNDEDINDAIQNTIIKSYKNIRKLKESTYFKTWIIRILINECNNIIKEITKYDKIKKKIETSEEIYIIKDNREIKIDIPEVFYNRESMVYKVKEISNDNFNITESTVYNTGMKFEFVKWEENWYDENDSQEEKDRKFNEVIEEDTKLLNEACKTGDFSKVKEVQDIYVENERGERFYPTVESSSSENSGMISEPNGRKQYWQTLNLTVYDATNNLNIYFKYKGEPVEIKLQRK